MESTGTNSPASSSQDVVSSQYLYASGTARRAVAWLIDLIVLGRAGGANGVCRILDSSRRYACRQRHARRVFVTVVFSTEALRFSRSTCRDQGGAAGSVCGTYTSGLYWLVSLMPVLYFVVVRGIGGTLGQRVLGIRVVDAPSGQSIGLVGCFVRYVGFIIALIPLYLGAMWVGWDSRKQGWHDKMASSV